MKPISNSPRLDTNRRAGFCYANMSTPRELGQNKTNGSHITSPCLASRYRDASMEPYVEGYAFNVRLKRTDVALGRL